MALMRALRGGGTMSMLSTASSSPSICVVTRLLRAERNCCGVGRSGCIKNRDWPALASNWPEALQSTTSLAASWSRRRSSTKLGDASGDCDSWVAA